MGRRKNAEQETRNEVQRIQELQIRGRVQICRAWSSSHTSPSGNGKKPTVVTQTFWQVRASSIRKLNRTESQPGSASVGAPSPTTSNTEDAIPF